MIVQEAIFEQALFKKEW